MIVTEDKEASAIAEIAHVEIAAADMINAAIDIAVTDPKEAIVIVIGIIGTTTDHIVMTFDAGIIIVQPVAITIDVIIETVATTHRIGLTSGLAFISARPVTALIVGHLRLTASIARPMAPMDITSAAQRVAGLMSKVGITDTAS